MALAWVRPCTQATQLHSTGEMGDGSLRLPQEFGLSDSSVFRSSLSISASGGHICMLRPCPVEAGFAHYV